MNNYWLVCPRDNYKNDPQEHRLVEANTEEEAISLCKRISCVIDGQSDQEDNFEENFDILPINPLTEKIVKQMEDELRKNLKKSAKKKIKKKNVESEEE